MPRSRRIDPFCLVVVDRDRRTFTVEGPMSDDTSWVNAVCRAQEAGRQVNCFTSGSANPEQAAADYAAESGYSRVARGSIL